jgi:hypothetical protein
MEGMMLTADDPLSRLALANARYSEVDGGLTKRERRAAKGRRCDLDETDFNRAADERWEAEEAVRAIKSDAPEIVMAKIRIAARRAAMGLDVTSELAAIAAN